MTMQQRSTAFAILAPLGMALIWIFGSEERYTFGHADWVDWAVVSLLFLLGLTNAFIATVMWIQRSAWLPSEASMFRWIISGLLLWFNFVVMFVFLGRGVRLDIVYIYVLLVIVTIDMDVKMAGRYLLRWEAKEAWDGTFERRNGPPGRRRGDKVA